MTEEETLEDVIRGSRTPRYRDYQGGPNLTQESLRAEPLAVMFRGKYLRAKRRDKEIQCC